jgi:hypothetical protein
MVSLESVLKVLPATSCQSMGKGQDGVILSLDSGYLYTGNQTTQAFMAALDGRRTIRDAAALLAGQFEAPLERLHADLVVLAQKLLEERLVAPVGE